jgi:hypothetical protein
MTPSQEGQQVDSLNIHNFDEEMIIDQRDEPAGLTFIFPGALRASMYVLWIASRMVLTDVVF